MQARLRSSQPTKTQAVGKQMTVEERKTKKRTKVALSSSSRSFSGRREHLLQGCLELVVCALELLHFRIVFLVICRAPEVTRVSRKKEAGVKR